MQEVNELGERGPLLAASDREVRKQKDYSLGMLNFLKSCNTTYCAWMDSNIMAHRLANEPGWVDLAIDALEKDVQAVVAEGPQDFYKLCRGKSPCTFQPVKQFPGESP